MTERIHSIDGIFEEELSMCPRLMPVVVAKLNGTKTALAKVFQATKNLPLVEELKHLRRIRDLPNGEVECIICRFVETGGKEKAEAGEFLLKIEQDLKLHDLLSEFRLIEVPISAPQTELQRKATQLIWPCKYAKNEYLNNCLSSMVFDDTERLILDMILDHSLRFIDEEKNDSCSVAVIFKKNKIYGFGSTSAQRISQNMTLHAAMIAIDKVSKGMGGGHWKKLIEEDNDSTQKQLQSRLDTDDRLSGVEAHNNSNPYLCTNYDIFVTEEPCFMCLMGMVQSRIRRLFYLDSSSLKDCSSVKQLCFPDKAIEKHRLHRDKRLNHRFEAWRVKLNSSKPEVPNNLTVQT